MPEAINGGPIALVNDGDKIVIDSVKREINWLVDEEEQARRKKEWEASGKNQIREKRGILYKYARDVAVRCVVNPTGFCERWLTFPLLSFSPRTSVPTPTKQNKFYVYIVPGRRVVTVVYEILKICINATRPWDILVHCTI